MKSDDRDAGLVQALHRLGDGRLMLHDIEPAFGRQLLAAFRHQRRLIGLHLAGDADDLVGDRHFEVEQIGDDLPQDAHIAVLDVPAVFAQMDGDAVGAAQQRRAPRQHGIGFQGAASLPNRGDVIDVDAQANHERSRAMPMRALPWYASCHDALDTAGT